MAELILPPPSDTQARFLKERHKYVAFGGARGGGKSWAVRTKAVLMCENYPGIKVLIVRKTYPELYENHIVKLCELLKCYNHDPSERLASYNDAKKQLTFPNGSRIIFRYCENDKDAERFQGTETDVLFIDEATHQSEERYRKLVACVRGVNDFPKRVYITCNPGGEGHQWVKRLFIDRKFKQNEIPDEYTFIQSKVTDNKALMKSQPEYVRQLEALPPKLRKAWLDGRWDIFEGAFFEEFRDEPSHYEDRRWTHVIEPFRIPDDWRIYRAFDWGYNKPFACGWYAVSRDGTIYHFLEYYGCTDTPNEGVKKDAAEVFSEIHKIETEHPLLAGKKILGIADPAIWATDTGESIAETAARYHVYFSQGDNKRIAGWMQCHYYLRFDENGFPMFYVFSNCKNFIRTIPLLQYDKHKPEDLDTEGEDHIADSWRYMLMSRPIKPRKIPHKDEFADNPLNVYLDVDKNDLTNRPKIPKMEILAD